MASAKDIKTALGKWAQKLANPEVASEFEGYKKCFQLSFPDINLNVQFAFDGPKVSIIDGINPKAEMSLTVDSDMFLGIASGEVDPEEAFMEGTLKPKGNMQDLEKLSIFMESDD